MCAKIILKAPDYLLLVNLISVILNCGWRLTASQKQLWVYCQLIHWDLLHKHRHKPSTYDHWFPLERIQLWSAQDATSYCSVQVQKSATRLTHSGYIELVCARDTFLLASTCHGERDILEIFCFVFVPKGFQANSFDIGHARCIGQEPSMCLFFPPLSCVKETIKCSLSS